MSTSSGTIRLHDHRVPPVAVVPQLLAPALLAGDPYSARLALILAVGGNVPLALAGRLELDPKAPGRLAPAGAVEWARPTAAWMYALALVGMLAIVEPAHQGAVFAAVVASVAAGALVYLLPGESTPEGARLRLLRTPDRGSTRERTAFAIRRLGHLCSIAVVPLLVIAPFAGIAALVAAAGCRLTLHTLRRFATQPHDAADLGTLVRSDRGRTGR